MVASDLEPPRTHDLLRLLSDVARVYPDGGSLRESAITLSSFGVVVRYPGDAAEVTVAEAAEAHEASSRVRDFVRSTLKL